MGLTPTVQRNAVSEGIALGLVVCRRDALPFDKGQLGRAFETAWGLWPQRVRFPQIETDLNNGDDGLTAMTRADTPKQAWALYWEQDGPELVIRARQPDWSPDDAEDLNYAAAVIDGDVPLADWEGLARVFLQHLDQ